LILGETVTPNPFHPLGVKGVGEAGCNGAPPAVANAVMDALAPLGIELCEQPTPDLRGLEGCPVVVAADEMLASDVDGALRRARVVVLKPVLLGGLTATLALARRAHARGLKIVVTTALESAVGRAGAAHLAAAVLALGAQPAAGIATGRLLAEDVGPDPFAARSGVVHIPDVPGLGLRVS